MAAGVGPELLLRIELVLEELLVNHVLHAYGSGEGDSEVACFCRAPAYFCLEVVDEAAPFDPLGPWRLQTSRSLRRIGPSAAWEFTWFARWPTKSATVARRARM